MSELYVVRISSAVRRQLAKLPNGVALAVVDFVTHTLPENPLRLTKPLAGEFAGLRSGRRGDYRVLVRVDEAERVVLVVRVAHRSHVCRPPAP